MDPEDLYSGRARGVDLYRDVGDMEPVFAFKEVDKEVRMKKDG